MPELLSICIPTFNRAPYLRDLLNGLLPELAQTPGASDLVRLYISDNASTDSTREVIEAALARWPLIYNRNPVNIGGDPNFAQMIARATGTYFWLLGDDEWIIRGCLGPLLHVLMPATHHLVLLETVTENGQPYGLPDPPETTTFPDYTAFVAHYGRSYPWKLMLHSFISMMVIKRSIYDQALARRVLGTVDRNYAHMYGLVEGLSRHPGSIHLQRLPSVRVRDSRALVDTSVLQMSYLWSRYYLWLAAKFGHPDLIVYGRKLFGWRTRCRLIWERIQGAIGLGPKITR